MRLVASVVTGTLLVLSMCKGEARGCHYEAHGPRVQLELQTREALTAIPDEKRGYVGLWLAPNARLLIRADGELRYRHGGDTASRTIKSSIQSFDTTGFTVGHNPVKTYFRVDRSPHEDAGKWKMTLDGIDFERTEDNRSLAGKYLEGDGVPKSPIKAAELLTNACKDDDDELSCALLGAMYENGEGVTADATKAAELYKKACDAHDGMSCDQLGMLYWEGKGVASDKARAIALFTDACSREDASGCYNLGVAYDTGEGVTRDSARAADLYAKGCDRGKAQGCQNLAIMYETGEGISKNLPGAMALYERACRGGLEQSCRYAKVLAGQ